MTRITGGLYRSRLLVTPKGSQTKPTMDAVREGVFSALSNSIKDASVLDLFAGSGAYGFEAMSRLAKKVTFVDRSHEAIFAIKQNINTLGINEHAKVLSKDYKAAINLFESNNEQFNVIFIDPPYKFSEYQELVDTLIEKGILATHGIIVVESHDELKFELKKEINVKEYKYGYAKVYIVRS